MCLRYYYNTLFEYSINDITLQCTLQSSGDCIVDVGITFDQSLYISRPTLKKLQDLETLTGIKHFEFL